MRLLFSTCSSASYMAPPRLADEQVDCGPYFMDQQREGRFVSLATPKGEYDLAAVAARLPADQQPDVVVCLVDASRFNLPRNLAAFRCPKVLLVADTHHLTSPLLTVLRYASTERYDRVVLLYDRHHAAFFRTAGVGPLYWFPGLTFPHEDATLPALDGPRRTEIAFVGQAGRHHPRRARLLGALTEARLPLHQRQLAQREALAFYGGASLGFNASLNGDLNLRVFEILAAGALLVTDRLAPGSGLGHLLADGRDSVWYDGPGELAEKAAHYLSHPAESAAVAAAGAAWFRRTLGAERRRAMFRSLAFDGIAPESFPLPVEQSAPFRFSTGQQFLVATRTYEEWQERHRTEEHVSVALSAGSPAGLAAMAATLPRCTVESTTATPLAVATEARARLDAGDALAALELARQAFAADPVCVPAMAVLAELALTGNNPALAEKLLRRAQSLAPDNAGVAAAAGRLGLLLRRQGALAEGLRWQRRAAGVDAALPRLDPAVRPVRVAFLAQHPQGWTSLESVWRELANDLRFEAEVIALPYLHPYPPEGGPDAIYAFLQGQGVPYTRGDRCEFQPDFADIVFLQNPYDVTRPAAWRTGALLRRVARLAYVPYGLEIGGGDTNAANQFNLPLQQHAWLVCARSVRHRAMFERHCAAGAGHVAVTGHPRLDGLRALDRLPPDPEFAAFARGRKLVCWNPQFDVRADGTGYSTFLRWQEFLLEEFARRPDLAFVIRPHPLFFGTLEARRLWSRSQIDDFLGRVTRAGNVLIDRRESYLPVFQASAAMLSDASTFLLEYSGTGKPLLYLHNPQGPSLNADGEFIRRCNYSAETREEIGAFLDQVTRGEDPKAVERARRYPEVMHFPAGGVASAIKQVLLDRLAAEAAGTDRVRAEARITSEPKPATVAA